MEAEAADLKAQYVVRWGEFGAEDLKHIEASLRDTLSPHLQGPSVATGSGLDIHVVIRRYAVRTSNTAGVVLACVAWAVTNADGGVIFREQFFSSHAGRFVGTIGRIKDSVNVAIVRRIATTALELAADPETMPQARAFQDTYASFDEAITPLPRFLVSLGDPSLAAFPFREVSVVDILTPSGISTVEWETAQPAVEFDWETYLVRLRTAR